MERIRNYAISINNEDMFITILRNGKTYYTNYDKGFYELMQSGVFTSATTNNEKGNYLKYVCTGTQYNVYFHHIVFGYYHRGLNKDNYVDVLRQFRNELEANNLNVDHLQGGVYNNRKCNLSLMAQVNNLRKLNVDKRFKYLFDVVSAYDGKGYRVQFTYLKKDIRAIRYYCNTIEELNALYRYLNSNKWKLRSVKAGARLSDGYYSSTGKTEPFPAPLPRLILNREYDIQKHLLELDKAEFDNKYTKGVIC